LHPASKLTALRVLRQAGGMDARAALPELLLSLRREDILTPFWRANGGRGGIFRINQAFIAANAPCSALEDAPRCPVAVSTYDVFARRTVVHTSGHLASVVAASCAIPIVMQPVVLNGRLHVDGFVEDLLALESCGADERVLSVNLHFRGAMRRVPSAHKALLGARATPDGGREVPGCRHGQRQHTTLLQLHQLPLVGPTSMQSAGAKALVRAPEMAIAARCKRVLTCARCYESLLLHPQAAGRDAMRAALQERRRWGGQRIHAVKPAPRM
jgi:predicted acylesterase/phospholipase RssA